MVQKPGKSTGAAAQGCAGFKLIDDDEQVLLELAG